MVIDNVNLVLPRGLLKAGCVTVRDGKIAAIGAAAKEDEQQIDGHDGYLAPGFIELHMHIGYLGAGYSPDRELELCGQNLPRYGTTRYLVTLISALEGNLAEYIDAVRRHKRSPPAGARCIGVHLEGPYIAQEARGGFLPSQITTPTEFDMLPILDADRDVIRTMTLSPELPETDRIIRACVERGIVVGLGHTKGDEGTYRQARAAGAAHITHCYNNRRDFPTVSGGRGFNLDDLAVADDGVTCELICDGVHVHPVWVKTIYRTKGADKICLITDSFTAGQPLVEGQTFQTAGGQALTVRSGVGRDAAGGLAGSVLTQDRAVRNFMDLSGAPLHEAIAAASLAPARVLGIDRETGSLEVGKKADLVLLDRQLIPIATWVEGEEVFARENLVLQRDLTV